MSPTPLRPVIPKHRGKLRFLFRDICSECGRYHLYRRYPGWDRTPNHVPLCYPRRHDQLEFDL
jgi:hypothetical protein